MDVSKTYDLICIGAGSGGIGLSTTMNQFGFKVLLIDKSDPSIGGDCLNFGCIPSKALIHTAKLAHDAKKAERFGLQTSGEVDLKKIQDYVSQKRNIIRKHENADYFRSIGIDVALGEASFASENSVMVDGKEYHGKKIVICTGSSPRELKLPGSENVKSIYTNETIFDEVPELPKKLVVIGGGPIGMELGQAFARLGSKVSFLIRGSQFLPKEDPDIAAVLRKQIESEGIELLFEHTSKSFSGSNTLMVEDKSGEEKNIEFDAVLAAIGRVTNTKGLNLEKAGIEVDEKGRIKNNEYLETSNKNVYVCGDIAGGLQFTHAAELHARTLMFNWFSPIKKKVNTDTFPWATYTSPEIATWGMNEKTLKERGIDYEVIDHNFTDDDRAIVDENTAGRVKLFVSGKKLLGGTMVAENAGELSQELMLTNSAGIGLDKIFNKIYPYPTAARVNQAAIMPRFLARTIKYKNWLKKLYH